MPGDQRQTRRVIQGILIAVALLAAAVFVFLLDDAVQLLQRPMHVTAVLDETQSLRPGAPVWIAGNPVGTVTAIEFMPRAADTTARLALTLRIPSRFRTQLRTGSRVRITSDRFIGEPVVDIVPGAATASELGPADTLYARPVASVALMMERGKALRAAVDSLNREARPLTPLADRRRTQTARMQRTLDVVTLELNAFSAALANAPVLTLLQGEDFQATLARLGTTMRELSAGFARVSAEDAVGPRDVSHALARLQQRSTTLAADLEALQIMMNETGTLRRLQTDSAILRAVHGVQAQLDSLVVEASKNPFRFVF
jgi:hypothetical protein